MITENDVVKAVAGHLVAEGWLVMSSATTIERGEDIVAERGDERLIVEAKGATSSKDTSSRYGSPFTLSQVRTHVGVAVLRALRIVSEEGTQAAIALPDNAHHRSEVAKVRAALVKLGIGVFWVNEQSKVSVDDVQV